MRIYIAGPMTGIKDFNYPAFHAAAKQLRAYGDEIINPAEVVTEKDKPWAYCIRKDIAALLTCECIYMLRGYQSSRGAMLELQIATELGMNIRYQI